LFFLFVSKSKTQKTGFWFAVPVGFVFAVRQIAARAMGFWRLRWHPHYVFGLLALPLCGAAPTFFACCKESRQRKQLTPSRLTRARAVLSAAGAANGV
jgi:hypothetical protein